MEPVQHLPFQVLEEITHRFSTERLLGSGSFGMVYKGIHKNGDEVAVKMVRYQLKDERFKELRDHWRLDHPNIVRLVAYCDETEHKTIYFDGKLVKAEVRHRALCLEYMHNGSLGQHLSDECDGLDWHTRYKIIKGTSEGLKYLHVGYTIPIYHLDLKPDNILLDRNMVPKLADFGLSPFGSYATQMISSPIGTIGYLPPEYIDDGIITAKFDIFSLGVVMIKIIAGRSGHTKIHEMPPQEFIDQVQGNWRNRLQSTWSGSLLEAYCQQVKTCTEIALNCLEPYRYNNRPSIAEIVLRLNEMETMIEELKNDAESPLDEVQVPTAAPVEDEEAPVVVEALQPTAVVVEETLKETEVVAKEPETEAEAEAVPAETETNKEVEVEVEVEVEAVAVAMAAPTEAETKEAETETKEAQREAAAAPDETEPEIASDPEAAAPAETEPEAEEAAPAQEEAPAAAAAEEVAPAEAAPAPEAAAAADKSE